MSTLLEQALQGRPLDLDIIDMHAHIGRYSFSIPDLSPESIVRVMDRMGVRRLVCSPMRVMTQYTEEGNALVLDAMKAHPERILGYVAVRPLDADKVRTSVLKWLDAGFTGIKLHSNNGFPYSDAAYTPAYEIANERCLPVLFHTWGEPEMLDLMRELSAKYPDASLLLAHAGTCNEEGYISIARDCPNVYLDPTLSISPRGLIQRLVEGAGADRIVWGSDACFLSMAQQLGKVVAARIPEEDKKKILRDNAERILARVKTA